MTKKKLTNEERIIDLLEKNLIVSLYMHGANRDEIKKMLSIGSEKVTPIIGPLSIKREKKNG